MSVRKIAELTNYILELEKIAPRMTYNNIDFAVLEHSDGDSCLFNGLLSTVGVSFAERAVLFSQASMNEKMPGMFYRSPRRRYTNNEGYTHFFSRDMSLGVLCVYATSEHDLSESARNWLHAIKEHSYCQVKKPWWLGGGCAIRVFRFAPDDRSIVTPAMWALMNRVWRYRKWPLTAQMKEFDKMDGDASVIEAMHCDLGYQLHLKAVQAYIKLLLGQSREFSEKVGQIAFERVPENLFYEFLTKRKVTGQMLDRFLEIKPDLNKGFGNEWVWEKDAVRPDKSCGWDFVFLGKLFLKWI